MTIPQEFVVDFIARGTTPDEWRMVLVEQGPWTGQVENHLRRLQARLYDCLDAALDGQLGDKFPQTIGKRIVIQVDCYNVPHKEVAEFFEAFSKGVLGTSDYRRSLSVSKCVSGIGFEINFEA